MKRKILILLILSMIVSVGFVTEAHATEYTAVKTGQVVNVKTCLNVRKETSATSKSLGTLKKGSRTTLKGYTKVNGKMWYRIRYKGKTGWLNGKYIRIVKPEKDKGKEVVKYAKKQLGTPYVWGGTSLSRGVDCSGFTRSVYAKFGKKIPHYSYSQEKYGKKISYSKIKPGDLICYGSHVAIYTGNGNMIHASSSRGKVVMGKAKYRAIKTIRRIV